MNIINSDATAIYIATGSTHTLLDGVFISACDGRGIQPAGPTPRIVSCYVGHAASDSIQLAATGDNSSVIGCMVQASGGTSIDVVGDAEDCVVVGNRTDGAVNDASGTSTVASNDETAF